VSRFPRAGASWAIPRVNFSIGPILPFLDRLTGIV